jgi:hypothetical protein
MIATDTSHSLFELFFLAEIIIPRVSRVTTRNETKYELQLLG